MVSWAHGQGRIFWSADDAWLSNERIDQADNLTLALRLLQPPPGRVAAFDEYHHMIRAPDRWWQVLRGPLLAFVGQAAFALILFYWASGMRFGSPRLSMAGPPRASVEYVYSMSHLYERAGARAAVQRAIYRWLTHHLRRMCGGPTSMSHHELALRVEPLATVPASQIETLLTRLDPAVGQPTSEMQLLSLVREATLLRRSVQRAAYRDQRTGGANSSGDPKGDRRSG